MKAPGVQRKYVPCPKICEINVSYVNSQLRKSFPIKAPEGLIESFLRKFSPLMAVSQVEKKGKIIRM